MYTILLLPIYFYIPHEVEWLPFFPYFKYMLAASCTGCLEAKYVSHVVNGVGGATCTIYKLLMCRVHAKPDNLNVTEV